MRLPGAIAFVVLALLGLLLSSSAVAAPTWLSPVTVSAPGDENTRADLAIGPDGTVIAVWQRAECAGAAETHDCKNGRVQYSVRPPSGSFSVPIDMPGDPFASNTAFPQVGVDGAGNAIAAWVSGTGESARVRYSIRPAGGTFGGSKTVPDAVGNFHGFPSLAVAPSGRAVVTFQRQVGGMSRASYAIRAPGGDFDPAQTMPADPGTSVNESPVVHLDGAGRGIANWVSTSPAGAAIRYADLPAAGVEFEPTQTMEQGANGELAMAPSGAAVMVWSPPGAVDEVRYSFRAPGGDFGSANSIPEPDQPLAPRVAIAPDGSAVAAWSSLIAPDSFVRWAAAPPGGPFGPPTPMPPGGEGVLGDLEISDQGTALALWVDASGVPFEMRASLRPADGVFGEPAVLPGPQQGVELFGGRVAFDPEGNAAALWNGRDPSVEAPHDVPLLAAIFDASDPLPVSGSPSITGLRLQPRRFRVARAPTAKVSRKPGTTIRFRLSEPATVRLTVQRGRPGVRVKAKGKARCLPSTRRNRRRAQGKRRCTRFRNVGRIVRRGRKAGTNRIAFSGRIGSKSLRPGRYRLVGVAIDESNERSLPRRAGFRVLR